MKKMLIDYLHPEETRVAIVDTRNKVEDFDIETTTKKEVKGNIYLAKVVRVEPSLQACFIEYGQDKQGFLPFSEIHPDYYQMPKQDKEKLLKAMSGEDSNDEDLEGEGDDNIPSNKKRDIIEHLDDHDEHGEKSFEALRKDLISKYKIQDVIKARQVILVQVEKEERGNKCAAVTTYLSMAGMYCVFMPNSGKKIKYGISRKISFRTERKRLKDILKGFKIKAGSTLIVRTMGDGKTKKEIKADYEYLNNIWEDIKEKTMKSEVPSLIWEESDLITRAIRDMYKDSFDGIIVDGQEGFEKAQKVAKNLSLSEKIITLHEGKTPLFMDEGVEGQLDTMHSPTVKMQSGAYLVINQTEALVAIDVNSGKATKERNITDTSLKTNIESAHEIARQLKLRDMAGLVVIDFIDMASPEDNYKLEGEMRKALRNDRARIQMGRVNNFGLMILSRQRLKPSFEEASYKNCPHCSGVGLVPSVQTAAVMAIRHIEENLINKTAGRIIVSVPTDVALYILNQKRYDVAKIEDKYKTTIVVIGDDSILNDKEIKIEKLTLKESIGTYVNEKAPIGFKKKTNRKHNDAKRTVRNTEISQRGKTKPYPKKKKSFWSI